LGKLIGDVAELVEETRASNICWLGFRTDLPELLPTCHAQILLSRNEGMAKSLLEGAACGLATIATIDCGFPLENEINGFLVERSDPAGVAELLKRLHENPTLCEGIGANGRQTVLDGYSWTAFRRHFALALDLSC
jgi:glycosyltransferase involved in cell wall biosynthesis